MTRIRESLTPSQASRSIAQGGIEAGAPERSAPIPAESFTQSPASARSGESDPGYRHGPPASRGPANYLTGGFLVLDPGPPSAKASGEGSWGRGGAITPIPGPLGEDASIHAELEQRYHMPEGSEAQERLPRGREGQDFGAPGSASVSPEEIGKVHGGDQTMPTTPEPNVTAGPKGDRATDSAVDAHPGVPGPGDYVVQRVEPSRQAFVYRGYRG
jgi:hypothetical protein